jgi:hypothetical protein
MVACWGASGSHGRSHQVVTPDLLLDRNGSEVLRTDTQRTTSLEVEDALNGTVQHALERRVTLPLVDDEDDDAQVGVEAAASELNRVAFIQPDTEVALEMGELRRSRGKLGRPRTDVGSELFRAPIEVVVCDLIFLPFSTFSL